MRPFLINPHCSFPVALQMLMKRSGIYFNTLLKTEALHHFLTSSSLFFSFNLTPLHLLFILMCVELQPRLCAFSVFLPLKRAANPFSYWVTLYSRSSLNFRAFFFLHLTLYLQNLLLSLCVFLARCNTILTPKVKYTNRKIFTVPSVINNWI